MYGKIPVSAARECRQLFLQLSEALKIANLQAFCAANQQIAFVFHTEKPPAALKRHGNFGRVENLQHKAANAALRQCPQRTRICFGGARKSPINTADPKRGNSGEGGAPLSLPTCLWRPVGQCRSDPVKRRPSSSRSIRLVEQRDPLAAAHQQGHQRQAEDQSRVPIFAAVSRSLR